MYVEFKAPRSERGPLAEAALKFTADEGPLLAGLELHGFTIWRKRETGEAFVKLPGRDYESGGQKKSFDFLRYTDKQSGGQILDRLRGLIVAEYQEWARTNGRA
jgi:hypothetical protein